MLHISQENKNGGMSHFKGREQKNYKTENSLYLKMTHLLRLLTGPHYTEETVMPQWPM